MAIISIATASIFMYDLAEAATAAVAAVAAVAAAA